MSQSVEGARKAQATIRRLYGVDPETGKSNMYMMIGRKGGIDSGKYKGRGGFAKATPERLREISAKGGSASRRPKAKRER